MKTLKLLTALFITICMYNCSSDDSTDQSQTQQPGETNLRLKSLSVGFTQNNYNYYSQGLLSNYENEDEIHSLIYNSNDKIIENGPYNYTHNYEGLINTITKATSQYNTDTQGTFTYNEQGLIITSSFQNTEMIGSAPWTYNIYRVYEYNDNGQLISMTEDHTEYNLQHSRSLIIYDSDNNIAKIESQTSSDGLNFTTSSTTNYTYDNKINPGYLTLLKTDMNSRMSVIKLENLYSIEIGFMPYFKLHYYNPNNITSINKNSTITTFVYEYNSNDLPVFCTKIIGSNTTNYVWDYEDY